MEEEKFSISKIEFVDILIKNPNILKGVKQYKAKQYQYIINEVCGTKYDYKIPWDLKSSQNDLKNIQSRFKDFYAKYKMNQKNKSRGTPLNDGFSNEAWICHENYPNLFPDKIISNKMR